jgi:hypothetical protein
MSFILGISSLRLRFHAPAALALSGLLSPSKRLSRFAAFRQADTPVRPANITDFAPSLRMTVRRSNLWRYIGMNLGVIALWRMPRQINQQGHSRCFGRVPFGQTNFYKYYLAYRLAPKTLRSSGRQY